MCLLFIHIYIGGLFADVDMPVQEHKSSVGFSYISVSSRSPHALAWWDMAVLQHHTACERTGNKRRAASRSECKLAFSNSSLWYTKTYFHLAADVVTSLLRSQREKGERETTVQRLLFFPINSTRCINYLARSSRAVVDRRGAKGTEWEKGLWFLPGINLYCSEKTWLGGGLWKPAEYEKSGIKDSNERDAALWFVGR